MAKTTESSGPRILFSTGSMFHLPPQEAAFIAAEAGFDGVEYMVATPANAAQDQARAVDEACPIRSLHAPFRDWSKWGGHLAAWETTIKLANTLPHARQVTLHPPPPGLGSIIQSRWFSKAHDLPLLLNAKGRLELSLENMPWVEAGPFGPDPLKKLVRQCRDKNVGLTLDVCHLGVSGRNILEALDTVPVQIIRNVHFSDAKGYREHMTPGLGELPLWDFLATLGKTEYAGFITLELEPAAFPDDWTECVRILHTLRQRISYEISS